MRIDFRKDARWKVYIHIVPKDVSGYEWDKYYVGITSRDVKLRWGRSNYKTCTHFNRAIEKYGWENIEHEVIAENLTKDESCEMEISLIRELKSNDYNYGYNITSGGEGRLGLTGEKNPNYGKRWNEEQRQRRRDYLREHPIIHTEESKKKISEASKKRWNDPEYRVKTSEANKKKWVDEDCRKIASERAKKQWQNLTYRESMSGVNAPCYGRTGEKHPMFGLTGGQCPQSKKVVCLTTNTIYPSAKDASKYTGANYSKLCMCCRGERKSSGKDKNGNPLKWKYYKDYLQENNLTDEEARNSLFFVE